MSTKFRIYRGGKVEITPIGYPGPTCKDATRPYEERLAGDRTTKEVDETTTNMVETQEQQQTGS